jgi:transposase
MVTIGIDTHKATLAVSAIDEAGRERAAETFPNDREGHARLLQWARIHGPIAATLRDLGFRLVRCGSVAPGSSRLVSRWSRCPRC